MRKYLSYGGGVNSTACIALHSMGLLDYDEVIYVDHGCDWPETKEYVKMIGEKYPLTILKCDVNGFNSLYEYSWHYKMIPSRRFRWCTDKFKVRVINKYIERPCFSLIGISIDEKHRASISTETGVENSYPLIEMGINRDGCIEIIKKAGLPIPMKSGCWFCPFQRVGQWKKLYRKHRELYRKAKALENRQIEARHVIGKDLLYLQKKPLDQVVNEKQGVMFKEMKK